MKVVKRKINGKNNFTASIAFTNEMGMRVRKSRTFKQRSKAYDWGIRMEKTHLKPASPDTLLIDYARRYIEVNIFPFITDVTVKNYKLYMRHFKSRLSRVTLSQATSRVIQGYVDSLPYATKTVAKEVGLLKKVLAEAEAEGLITRNPVTSQTIVHGDTTRTKPRSAKFMPASEFAVIRSYLDDHAMDRMNYFLLFIIANTALRVGEAIALKRDDLNFEEHTIRVDETFDEASSQTVDPKTERSKRTIPAPATVMDKIHKWLHVQKIELFKRGIRNDDEFLFLGAKGKLPRVSSVNRSYQTLQRDLGYRTRYTTHTIRHTLASLMLEDPDIPLAYISRYLGHASESVTKKYYLGVIPDHVGKLEQDTLSVIKNL